MYIQSVEQRAGEARKIALHRLLRAGTLTGRVSVISAGARVHGADYHRRARIRERRGDAGNRYLRVLHRLAQHLHCLARELRQLIEEQHSVMRQGYLARARNCAAAREPRGRDGVVRRAERALGYQRHAVRQRSRDGVELRSLEALFKRHVRQYGRQALCEHTLSRAGRADHDYIVAACGGYFERTFYLRLSSDVAEVRRKFVGRIAVSEIVEPRGSYRLLAAQVLYQLFDTSDGDYVYALDNRAFRRVFRRDKHGLYPALCGGYDHGQRAVDTADEPIERNFADERRVVGVKVYLSAGLEQRHENGQVVYRALLARVRGREIHRNSADGKREARIFYRGADSVFRLAYRSVGQSDYVKSRQTLREIRLNLNSVAVHAEKPHAVYPCKQNNSPDT